MGNYSVLRIGYISLRAGKNDFDPTILILFDETDKRIREFSDDGDNKQNLEEWGEHPEIIVDYAISLEIAKDRLEFMGFTLSKTKRIFQEGREKRIANLAIRRTNFHQSVSDGMKNYLDQEENFWENLTFEMWLNEFKYIIDNRLSIDKLYDWRPGERLLSNQRRRDEALSSSLLSQTTLYMLDHEHFGFPLCDYDYRPFMRAVIEVIGIDTELVYDLTDPVACEYLDAYEDLCAVARWHMLEDPATQKIVVLTEGKSDKRVLEGSLQLLYPHLAGYYSFMDFDSARVAGSAAELVKTVKAFIGAGISNRIIALFDNDTAARSAMRALKEVKIPENVRISRYPDIQVTKDYPTLGPQGTVTMNVNGLAGSLELYFGRDVLTGENGSLIPIQWRGYDEALQQYQGEVLNKAKLQEKFEAKLRDCQADRSLIAKCDWDGIQAIIELLRTAFHD